MANVEKTEYLCGGEGLDILASCHHNQSCILLGKANASGPMIIPDVHRTVIKKKPSVRPQRSSILATGRFETPPMTPDIIWVVAVSECN